MSCKIIVVTPITFLQEKYDFEISLSHSEYRAAAMDKFVMRDLVKKARRESRLHIASAASAEGRTI